MSIFIPCFLIASLVALCVNVTMYVPFELQSFFVDKPGVSVLTREECSWQPDFHFADSCQFSALYSSEDVLMINFKANSDILHHYMKGINPHDEIKGSNPSPGASRAL